MTYCPDCFAELPTVTEYAYGYPDNGAAWGQSVPLDCQSAYCRGDSSPICVNCGDDLDAASDCRECARVIETEGARSVA